MMAKDTLRWWPLDDKFHAVAVKKWGRRGSFVVQVKQGYVIVGDMRFFNPITRRRFREK